MSKPPSDSAAPTRTPTVLESVLSQPQIGAYAQEHGPRAAAALAECHRLARELYARGQSRYAPNAATEPFRRAMRDLSQALYANPALWGRESDKAQTQAQEKGRQP